MNYLDQFNLKNKKVLILGGSGLIGKEIVSALAQTQAEVLVLDIKKLQSLNRIGYEYFDLSHKNYFNKFKQILSKFEPNIFLNCSYPHDKKWKENNFAQIKLKSFIRNIELNLVSYSILANLSAEFMVKKKINGSIIQFGSIYGSMGQDLSIYKGTDMRENMSYSIIKGGVHNLTRQMASYYGKYDIKVNTIAPGGVEGHVANGSKTQNIKFKKNYSSKVPLGRLANVRDIPGLVIFLCSNLSSYITGTTIFIDGGWTAI